MEQAKAAVSLSALRNGIASYAVGTIIVRLLGVALVPLYTHLFSAREYGQIELVASISTILAGVLVLGMDSAVWRFYYEAATHSERRLVVTSGFGLSLVATAITCTVGMLWSGPLAAQFLGTSHQTPVVMWALMSVFTQVASVFTTDLLRLQDKPLLYNIVSTIQVVSGILFALWFVNGLYWGVAGVFAAQAGAYTAGVVCGFSSVRRDICVPTSGRLVRPLLLFGMPFVPTSVAAWIMNLSDRLYVAHFNGNAELGIYAVANKLSGGESLLVSAFVLAWGPYAMAAGLSEHNARIYPTVLRYYWVGSLACALGLSALSPLALLILAGPAYSTAYLAVVPLTYGLAIGGAFSIVSMGSTLDRRSHHLMIAQVGGALSHLCLNFVLIPTFGMVGAAWSTFISACITLSIQLVLSQRTLPFPYPVKNLLVVFGFALLCGVVCTAFQGAIGTLGLVLSTLVRLLIPLFFVLVCVLFRVVPYAFWSPGAPRNLDENSSPLNAA